MGVEGILLYYSYVDLSEKQEAVSDWYSGLCSNLKLVGRVRVAKDGVNVTVRAPSPSILLSTLSSILLNDI